MSLNNIVIEQIKDNYYRGEFLGLDLVIDKNTGYFNASKLCKDGDKQFAHWHRSKKTKELLENVLKIHCAPDLERSGLYEVKSGRKTFASKQIAGTYVCKELILDIASWISSEFYLKCNKIIISHAEEEYKQKYETQLKEKDSEIKEKDCKIDKLLRKMEESEIKHENQMKEMMNKLNGVQCELGVKLDEANCKIDDMQEELSETREELGGKLDEVQDKLDRALPDRNIDPEDDELKHSYILFKSKSTPNEYVFVRGQDKHIELTKRKNNKTFEITIDKTKNPNPIDLINRLKDKIKIINEKGYSGIITSIRKSDDYFKGTPTQKRLMVTGAQKANSKIIYSGTKITLVSFTEEKLIELVIELDQDKYNI